MVWLGLGGLGRVGLLAGYRVKASVNVSEEGTTSMWYKLQLSVSHHHSNESIN
jgi:hypothetical protein